MRTTTPVTGFAYLDAVLDLGGAPLPMAHRGGAKVPGLEGLENTARAFRDALDRGYRYLETDVHSSSDGELFTLHDRVLDRVSDHSGPVVAKTADELAEVRIGGVEPIPRMADLLEEFPEARFNIDIKAAGAVEPLARLIEHTGAQDRLCVGAFDLERIRAFRRATGGRVATSAAKTEVVTFLRRPTRLVAELFHREGIAVLQLPRVRGPIPVVRPWLVRRAHAAGVHLHVWTVDRAAHFEAVIDARVDGIFTDRTDVLKDVLDARGLWREVT